MPDPLPYKIGAIEWYHDSKDGQRSHCWAEDPKPAPAILCNSEEQAEELITSVKHVKELKKTINWVLNRFLDSDTEAFQEALDKLRSVLDFKKDVQPIGETDRSKWCGICRSRGAPSWSPCPVCNAINPKRYDDGSGD